MTSYFLIKTYVSSSLPSNDDLVHSAKLKEVNEISDMEWDPQVIESELPVMVMFTAGWCGWYCPAMTDILEELDTKFTNRFKFYTLDIDDEEAISTRYHIQGVPTNIIFKGGDEVARVDGYYPDKVRELVDQYV
ncbi:hypothetical protein Bca101_018988 [Brassica carinata]